MLATLASAAAAPPLAPPSAADAPTLDLYVGDERRTTITTNFGTATEALAAAVLRAGDPGDAVEGRVVLAARIGGEAFEFVDPPSTALRPSTSQDDGEPLAFFVWHASHLLLSRVLCWKRLEPSGCVCRASLSKDILILVRDV